jgi:hypothetical protein
MPYITSHIFNASEIAVFKMNATTTTNNQPQKVGREQLEQVLVSFRSCVSEETIPR